MPEIFVGTEADLGEQDRRIIVHEGVEIGVFRVNGGFRAYQNDCPHRGGPVCQGRILNRVEEVLGTDKTSQGLRFSPDQVHLVCPWHGFEYNLDTGRHAGESKIRLRSFPIAVREGGVYVVV